MKNYLMFALLIGAASTMAFGQSDAVDITCEDCSHHVSVYMGEGGLIAETDADEVVWVTTCDGVTVSGELEPNDDGKVSMLFDDMNGLACHSDKGSLQLGPIMDGGWYWITDDMHSAVGGLVSKDVLENETVTVTSAGDGVTMTDGKGAVYLKETATGRVGILPNILAEPPAPPATLCGTKARKECMLGDGKTKIVVYDSDEKVVMSGDTVERPRGATPYNLAADDDSVELEFYVLGNGSGHISTSSASTDVKRGHDKSLPLVASFSGTAGGGPGTALPTAGVSVATDSSTGVGTVTIAPADTYCDPRKASAANHTATIKIKATLSSTDAGAVVPTATAPEEAFTLMVACPGAASSANLGTELVPDNPFPTDW